MHKRRRPFIPWFGASLRMPGCAKYVGMAEERIEPSRAESTIELRLREVAQLFNSLDPSPLREKDLDRDVEEFIVSWAQEFRPGGALRLLILLDNPLPPAHTPENIGEAVRNYFAYRAEVNRIELRELLKRGRTSLLIGVTFLSICLLMGQLVSQYFPTGAFFSIPREGLTIGGWVAMWRPMEIYLYDWWPIRRRVKLRDRLSHMKFEVRVTAKSEPQVTG
jgi:hypothetical protein